MSNFRISGPDNKGELIMGGKLTVEHAADIRAKLIEAFTKGDHILVSLEKDSEVDISFLQIICSAHKTACDAKKTFEFNHGGSEDFRRTAEQAGYVRKRGCTYETEEDCMWARRYGK